MAWYRIYLLRDDGHIGRAHDLECSDDADAIARMNDMHHPHGMELWQNARMIARRDGDSGSSAD